MGKKDTIQAATATEYVIRDGKHGVFSHADKGVCSAKLSALVVADHANGVSKNYKIYERTVTYPGFEKAPVGDESIGARDATVEETEIS